MRLEHDLQVQISGRAAVRAGPALAGEAQPLAVGRAARDARADDAPVEAHFALRAARRFLEAEARRHLVVLARKLHAAAAAGASARAAEDAHRLEKVRQVDVAQVLRAAAAEAVEPVGRRPEVLPRAVAAKAVVRGALVLVAQR